MTQIPTAKVVQAIAALSFGSEAFYMTWDEFTVLLERAKKAAADLAAAMKANKEGA